MNISNRRLQARNAFNRQRIALVGLARENLFLKSVALFTAAVLYIYVQTEHNPNPQVTVTLQSELKCLHVPDGVKWEPQQFPVKVTGPRILVESVKDADIRAEVDLSGIEITSGKTPPLVPKYSFPALRPEAAEQIHVEGPNTIRVQISLFLTTTVPVHVPLRPAPPGMHYERPTVTPDRVACTGLEADVKRVNRVDVAIEATPEGRIHGEFGLTPVDKDDHAVKMVTLDPDRARVNIPLVQDPPMQFALVSPTVTALPLPPYRVDGLTVEPPRVKIVGRPGRVDLVTAVPTQDISLQDVTADTDKVVDLLAPPDVAVYDPQGRPISHVHVRFHIIKAAVTPSPQVSPNDPASPPPINGH